MICKLSPEVIREIAAGEVIAGPADVLKELLENALDAGATRLQVSVEAGGIGRLCVRDNGAGIAMSDLALAAEAHCTSKLSSLTNIQTLGFRGEGLYAIRNAATLQITSRPATQLGGATLLATHDTQSVSEHPAPAGTSVCVTDLFAHLPARRHALHDASLETKKLMALLGRYVLHHPWLQLGLSVDGEERWAFAGGSFTEAVKLLWGPVTANRLLALHYEDAGMHVEGLLSRPELSRPRRDRLLLAVNGRPVQWPEALLASVVKAYRELLRSHHYPVGILNVRVPPTDVLVNTAPDKSRVKFLNEAAVLTFMHDAVLSALAKHPLAPALPELHVTEGLSSVNRHAFPKLTHLGTYQELYLLAEGNNNLWIIDQHAAHERILYERLSQRYQQETPVELEYPELLYLGVDEALHYEENKAVLQQFGIVLEPFGGQQWRVRSVPAFLSEYPQLVPDVIKGSVSSHNAEDAWRKVLGRLACLPAIKAGQPLSRMSAQALLDALRACDTPWACPHGRPTALTLSELELARKFGRAGVRASVRASLPKG